MKKVSDTFNAEYRDQEDTKEPHESKHETQPRTPTRIIDHHLSMPPCTILLMIGFGEK